MIIYCNSEIISPPVLISSMFTADFIPELLLICFTSTTMFLVKNVLKHIDKDMRTHPFVTDGAPN